VLIVRFELFALPMLKVTETALQSAVDIGIRLSPGSVRCQWDQ